MFRLQGGHNRQTLASLTDPLLQLLYCLLLDMAGQQGSLVAVCYVQGYNSLNSTSLNHALVSFLWRLALPSHLDLEAMLYQLSALNLFYKVLNDASLRKKPDAQQLLQLATKVVRGLFAKLVPPQKEGAPAAAAAAGAGANEQVRGPMEYCRIDMRNLRKPAGDAAFTCHLSFRAAVVMGFGKLFKCQTYSTSRKEQQSTASSCACLRRSQHLAFPRAAALALPYYIGA